MRDRDVLPARDLVERNFSAPATNRLWVADITYIPIWAGFLNLAVVLDAFSRRVVGWVMETYLRTELVLKALNMALAQRCPASVIHHSDHGEQPSPKPSTETGQLHFFCLSPLIAIPIEYRQKQGLAPVCDRRFLARMVLAFRGLD